MRYSATRCLAAGLALAATEGAAALAEGIPLLAAALAEGIPLLGSRWLFDNAAWLGATPDGYKASHLAVLIQTRVHSSVTHLSRSLL